jgi:hypothetical protein
LLPSCPVTAWDEPLDVLPSVLRTYFEAITFTAPLRTGCPGVLSQVLLVNLKYYRRGAVVVREKG